jgi:membrane protein YqaA with SNARE-associated domain
VDYLHKKLHKFVKDFTERQKVFWLSVISFIESSFFPIPPDPFLMLAVINKPQKWLKYFFFVSLFSVLGGIFGYFIGLFFFDLIGASIIEFYSLEKQFELVFGLFNKYSFIAIFVSAFTPIPYKIFTIASGLFGINFFVFVLASLIGRPMRFFIVAYLMKVFGEKFGKKLIKIIDIVLVTLVLLLIIYTVFSLFN